VGGGYMEKGHNRDELREGEESREYVEEREESR
jgi:hypothetical protein